MRFGISYNGIDIIQRCKTMSNCYDFAANNNRHIFYIHYRSSCFKITCNYVANSFHNKLNQMENIDKNNPDKYWKMLGDVPVDPDGEHIEDKFLHFDIGSEVLEIWHWFESHFNIAIGPRYFY